MLLSFSTLGCPRWTLDEILATAHDLGYHGIEVRGIGATLDAPSVPQFSTEKWPQTQAKLEKLALAIPCLASDCCLHRPAEQGGTKARVQAYVDLAQRLGVPYVRVMGDSAVPEPTSPVDEGFVKEFSTELAAYAKDHGVVLLMETNGVYCDSEKLARLIGDVASDHFKALWDVHHPYRFAGESPEVTARNLKGILMHVHMKDATMDAGKVRYQMLGRGDLPVKRIITALHEIGYEGYYCLEWLKRWDNTLEDAGIVFAQYVRSMKEYAKGIGQ